MNEETLSQPLYTYGIVHIFFNRHTAKDTASCALLKGKTVSADPWLQIDIQMDNYKVHYELLINVQALHLS